MASGKNIWTAAGDGDLQRVQELIERQSMSPNSPDENTYTPMHAAASYGHLNVLEYLSSKGGDVNITDEDGDTPLYTVENIETAKWLVEHGAEVDRLNKIEESPIEHLSQEFPDVANFLRSFSSSTTPISTTTQASYSQLSQHSQNAASELLTSDLMAQVEEIMQRAEAEDRNPDEELRQVVGRTVLEGVVSGYEMGAQASSSGFGSGREHEEGAQKNDIKRPRTNQ